MQLCVERSDMSKPMSVRNKVFPKYEPKDQEQHVMMVCPSRIYFSSWLDNTSMKTTFILFVW